MKKILLIISMTMILIGCSLSDIDNTPTKKVEAFFNNYQTLDKDVLSDLDVVIAKQTSFNEEQRKKYRNILKDHYQNLEYEIKDETVNGDKAVVEVEIEVTDLFKVMSSADTYLQENREKFLDSNNNFDESKYIDYWLDLLKGANERVKYTLNLTLSKKDKEWTLDDLDDIEEKKILGMYNY